MVPDNVKLIEGDEELLDIVPIEDTGPFTAQEILETLREWRRVHGLEWLHRHKGGLLNSLEYLKDFE